MRRGPAENPFRHFSCLSRVAVTCEFSAPAVCPASGSETHFFASVAFPQIHLIANGPAPGQYFCNAFNQFFNSARKTSPWNWNRNLRRGGTIPFSPKTQKQECGHIFPSSLRRSHRLPRSSFSVPVATLAAVCGVPRWLQVGRLQRMCRERPHSPTTSDRDSTASILNHAASR